MSQSRGHSSVSTVNRPVSSSRGSRGSHNRRGSVFRSGGAGSARNGSVSTVGGAISARNDSVASVGGAISARVGAVATVAGAISACDGAVASVGGAVSASPGPAVSAEGQCVLCYGAVHWRCVMDCGHVVCHQCGVRLRVLCSKLECPVCRQESTKAVILAPDPAGGGSYHIDGSTSAQFSQLFSRALYIDDRHKLAYDDECCRRACTALLQHLCPLCPEQQRQQFERFEQLQEHMRRRHQLYYCQICVDNLAVFSCERRCYTRDQLALHRRKGDLDDSSHKGHPLCQFCDVRYLDNDSLFVHLRRDHFICHLCENTGSSMAFYSSYGELEAHFRETHFLCDQSACLQQRFVVFSSKLDLQAHRNSAHGEGRSKQQQRLDRMVTLDLFTDGASVSSSGANSAGPSHRRRPDAPANSSGSRSHGSSVSQSDHSVEFNLYQRVPTASDFPSLSTPATTTPSSTPSPITSPPAHTAAAAASVAKPSGNPGEASSVRDANWFGTRHRVPRLEAEFPTLGGAGGSSVSAAAAPMARSAAGGVASRRPKTAASQSGGKYGDCGAARSSVSSLEQCFPALSCSSSATDSHHSRGTGWPHTNKTNNNNSSRSSRNSMSIINNNSSNSSSSSSVKSKPAKPASVAKSARVANFGADDFPSLAAPSANSDQRPLNSRHQPSSSGARSQRHKQSAPSPVMSSAGPDAHLSDPLPGGYQRPSQFAERNQRLVKTVRSLLTSDSVFDRFKHCSAEYRRGAVPASDYYNECVQLIGGDKFGAIFSELLVLLPDIDKQQELLQYHQQYSSNSDGQRTLFLTCPVCTQILVFDDYAAHTFHHYQNEQDPSSCDVTPG